MASEKKKLCRDMARFAYANYGKSSVIELIAEYYESYLGNMPVSELRELVAREKEMFRKGV